MGWLKSGLFDEGIATKGTGAEPHPTLPCRRQLCPIFAPSSPMARPRSCVAAALATLWAAALPHMLFGWTFAGRPQFLEGRPRALLAASAGPQVDVRWGQTEQTAMLEPGWFTAKRVPPTGDNFVDLSSIICFLLLLVKCGQRKAHRKYCTP